MQIEVDETSVYDLGYNDIRLGSIVRREAALKIAATPDGWRGRTALLSVVEGLPKLSDRQNVGFTRWQIVIGTGVDKRVLKAVDMNAAT